MLRRMIFLAVVVLTVGCSRIDTTKFRVAGWNDNLLKRIVFVVNGDNVGPVIEPGGSNIPFDITTVYNKPSSWSIFGPSDVRTASVEIGVRDADTKTIVVKGGCLLREDSVTNFNYKLDSGGFDRISCWNGLR